MISAVGHETDFTIADFVADLRASTPSAAAELVIRSRQEVEEQVAGLERELERGMRYRLIMGRQRLTELAQHGAFGRMMDLIRRRQQRVDDLTNRLAHAQRGIAGSRSGGGSSILAAAVRHYDLRLVLGRRSEGIGCTGGRDGGRGAGFVVAAAVAAGAVDQPDGSAVAGGDSGAWVCVGL